MLYQSHSLLNIQLIELCLLAGLRATNKISLPLKVFFAFHFPRIPRQLRPCQTIYFRAFQGDSFLTKTQNIKFIYGHQVRVQVELTCACILCQRRLKSLLLITTERFSSRSLDYLTTNQLYYWTAKAASALLTS